MKFLRRLFHIHWHNRVVPGSYKESRYGDYLVDHACRCGDVKTVYREVWLEEWR